MAEIFDLMELEVNIPSRDFGTYTTSLAAPPKFGKTEFCTKFENPLILDFEEGSKGKVTFRVPVSKWTEVKKYFKQLTKDERLKTKYKTICIDTVNYALEACKQYVMDEYQANHPEKVIDTFNKIPFGGGKELLIKEWKTEINKLKRAGYGVVFISHVKDKVFDKETEQEHTKTVPELSDFERNMISAMADFLLLGEFELEVIEPAQKDGNGKVIKEAVIRTNRVLYLRTNEEAEAGFRWNNVPEKIPFDFKIFKDVFLKAVDEEIETGLQKFNLTEEDAEEIRERLDEIVEQQEKEVFMEESLPDLVTQIKELVKSKRDSGIDTKLIKQALDNTNPDKITDIETAKSILVALKNL